MILDFLHKINILNKSPSIYFGGRISKGSKILTLFSTLFYIIFLSIVGYLLYLYFGLKNKPTITTNQYNLDPSLNSVFRLIINLRDRTTNKINFIDIKQIVFKFNHDEVISCDSDKFSIIEKEARTSSKCYEYIKFNINTPINLSISIDTKMLNSNLISSLENKYLEITSQQIIINGERFESNQVINFKISEINLTDIINNQGNLKNNIKFKKITTVNDIGFLWEIVIEDDFIQYFSSNTVIPIK